MNSDRATSIGLDTIQRVPTSYTSVRALPWKLRQNNDRLFIAANSHLEKVMNSLNADDKDDDIDYSGDEWRIYCIPAVL